MVLKDRYEPVTVDSGEAALAWLSKSDAALIFLDILMPGMDGLEVLEKIRSTDSLVPVVMVTATKTVKTAVTAMKLGAFDYITKPFDVEELRLVAERATENGTSSVRSSICARKSGTVTTSTTSSAKPPRCKKCSRRSKRWRG